MSDSPLDIGRLATLEDRELTELGHALTSWLAAERREWELVGVVRFETQDVTHESRELDDEHRTLVWHDPASRMYWRLVPGGELSPGYDARRLRRLQKRVLEMEPDVEGEASAVNLDEHVVPYASAGGWDPARLRQRPAVRIGAFLMPATPLLQSTPGVERLIEPSRVRLYRYTPGRRMVLAFHADEVERALGAMRCRLPTDVEMQWAMGGGRPWLFPWGDRLPRWMWDAKRWERSGSHDELAEQFEDAFRHTYESDKPEWTRSNRFGMVDPLVARTWCTLDGRLGYIGGAGDCFPWQGCGEWAGFLTAAAIEGQTESAALRPLVPLDSFVRTSGPP